jgi:hypothetical protein
MAKAKLLMHKDPAGGARAARQPIPSGAPGERERMIAQAAYFRALARGFAGGDPVEDWLAAEREISRLLPSPQQQRELAAYETLRQDVKKILAEARDTLNADTIRQALNRAVEQLRQLGEHTADTIGKVAVSVERDMAYAARRLGPTWETFSEKTADLFHVWHDRGGQFLARAATAVGEWLQQTGGKLKSHTYRSGEMATSGTLECTVCGERLVLETPAHLPLCPRCRNMEFRRL